MLVPILATALNGFKELGDLQSNSFGLPRVWVWQNYWDILTGYRYWQVLGNSLLIALLTVALTLALSSMAAFTFAHLRFFGDRFLLNYMLLGLLFPAATAILPLFIKIRDLGLLNSYSGIVLPQVAFSLAMSVLLLRNAFKQLPDELLDAAMMDGCGYFRYFFYITLPLSGPTLSTVAVISFVASWNGYLIPLVVLNGGVALPLDAGPDGLSGPIFDILAAGARLHHADDPAGDPDVPDGAEIHRRRADRGRGQGVKRARWARREPVLPVAAHSGGQSPIETVRLGTSPDFAGPFEFRGSRPCSQPSPYWSG